MNSILDSHFEIAPADAHGRHSGRSRAETRQDLRHDALCLHVSSRASKADAAAAICGSDAMRFCDFSAPETDHAHKQQKKETYT